MPRHHKELDAWWVTLERLALQYHHDSQDADFFEQWWIALGEAREWNDPFQA